MSVLLLFGWELSSKYACSYSKSCVNQNYCSSAVKTETQLTYSLQLTFFLSHIKAFIIIIIQLNYLSASLIRTLTNTVHCCSRICKVAVLLIVNVTFGMTMECNHGNFLLY